MPAAADRAALRPYRALFALFALAMAARATYTLDAIRDMRHEYPAAPVTLGSPWPSIVRLDDNARAAGLRLGDRVIAIDGRRQDGLRDLFLDLRGKNPGGEMVFSIDRQDRRLTLGVKLDSVRTGTGAVAVAFLSVEWILTPWLCFGIAFWVAEERVRDMRAWLLLGILLGIAEMTATPVLDPRGWGGIGVAVRFYREMAAPVWAICMMLFGIYFPQRWRFDRRFPWIKWAIGAPLAAFSLWSATTSCIAAIDYPAAAPWFLRIPAARGFANALAFVAPCLFFIGLSDKYRDASLAPGDRRRLKLLYFGTTAALSPLFLLILYTGIFHHRLPGDNEDVALALCNLALLIFPLTMAYAIVVQRAMDVRVVARQGLQYALARRGIRILQVVVVSTVVTIAANAFGSHASTPIQVTVIAVGVVVVLRIRPVSERLRLWLDRKFFREAYNAEQILSELSEQVRSILDARELLDTVARKISQSLHVDRMAVLLLDGVWYRPALAIGYGAPLDFALAADAPAVAQLRSSRAPVVVADGGAGGAGLERLDAQLLLPLASKKELLGFISLGPKKSEEPYSASDTSLLRTVAAQTGMALENSRLSEAIASEMAQRELLSREIEIAREVQQRLFPQTMPEVPALQYAGHCRPARGVGGDYYDFLALTGGSLGIAIGDVSGKGIPAALLMASLQASVRGQSLTRGKDVAGLMANVNRLVFDASQSNRYATFFYAQFEPATRKLVYTNGGHNPPVVLRGADAIPLEVGGTPVGLFRETSYEQAEMQLEPGDLLIFFTDGISEAENAANDEWGEDALISTVRACGGLLPAEIIARIMQAADDFAAGAPQHDDMTLVVARVL
ncbi:MAG: SpoIIE family protein phosphatase [Bryobacteraceae bacterium]|jgi:sigma-B regulation protein RsbU (phosphoserine phosphatase)